MGRGAAAAADFKTADVQGEMHLPIVDLSAPEAEAAATLKDACINHGFYYLAGWVHRVNRPNHRPLPAT